MRKTGTWLAGIVIGLTLGLTSTLLVNRPEVRADEKKPKWEYKVVDFFGSEGQKTKQIRRLADDGWEYVGLVSTSVYNAGLQTEANSSVAFKRPKK
jgi:hypothetical protein